MSLLSVVLQPLFQVKYCQLYTECLNSPEMSLEKSRIITLLVIDAAIAKLFYYLCLGCIQVFNLVSCGEFSWFWFALYLYLEVCNMH